jgi:hypothetical protein
MPILKQAEQWPFRMAMPTLYRQVNLRGFNMPEGPDRWTDPDDDTVANAVMDHLKSYPHGGGGAGSWWTPHYTDTESTINRQGQDFPVRLRAEWSGNHSDLDLSRGGNPNGWEGWKDEKFLRPSTPLSLTGIQVANNPDPLDESDPRHQVPWRDVLHTPRPITAALED